MVPYAQLPSPRGTDLVHDALTDRLSAQIKEKLVAQVHPAFFFINRGFQAARIPQDQYCFVAHQSLATSTLRASEPHLTALGGDFVALIQK